MDRNNRLSRTASIAYTKGLLNNPGENNCFLNSAVQVLWHLDVFRRSFRELSGHFCVGQSCIFCALKVIFTQFQYSDEVALPPDALRQALADTFKGQQRFQLQDMDDAAECLENILNRLHYHFAMNEKNEICSVAHCISHRKFAMEIMEQTICYCGATSEPLPFFQMVHYVSVSALCHEAEVLRSKMRGSLDQDNFGHLLKRAVNQGDIRDCPGKCGKRQTVQQSLLNCPDVVCIGLIWDSDNPGIGQVTELLHCIDPVLRLPEVFPRVSDDKAKKVELFLAGIVTYYGKHYSTFFFSNKLRTWIYFDDARVRKCGPDWEQIRDKCCQNHYQPLLLLYVNAHGRPVDTKHAPRDVKLVDTDTLLASGEWKKSDATGSPSEPKRKLKGDEELASSTHSLTSSDPGSEPRETRDTSPTRKNRHPMKRLKIIGTDIKRVFTRQRNLSPTQELNEQDVEEQGKGRNESKGVKENNVNEDLIKLNVDVSTQRTTVPLYTTQGGREVDETDSGLGSGGSQASSPATSSVSSVDTNTEDLIDFNTRYATVRSSKGDFLKVENLIEEAEGYLKESYQYENICDLPMALSMCSNASSRFRLAIERSTNSTPTFLTKLKNKHNMCHERARWIHRKITTEIEAQKASSRQQELLRQRQREKDAMKQMSKTATLPRSRTNNCYSNGSALDDVIVPMSSRSINDVYLKSGVDHMVSEPNLSSVADRRQPSRNQYLAVARKSLEAESEQCSQKIKPDMLCYSPVHYGKGAALNADFERMSVSRDTSSRDRQPTVTHVSTSFIPARGLRVEDNLLTSSAYVAPNSRASNDIRRCSIYDNLPPTTLEDRRGTGYSAKIPSDPPTKRNMNGEGQRSRSWTSPDYVPPPPYPRGRAVLQSTGSTNTLLQRFNVPQNTPDNVAKRSEDIRYLNNNDTARIPRGACFNCNEPVNDKNSYYCAACKALNTMLRDLKSGENSLSY